MAAPAFGTLRFQQKLAEVLEPRTATAVAEAFGEATTELASRHDLSLLESKVEQGFEKLRAEIHRSTADTIKWAVGSQIVIAGLIIAALRLLP